MRDNQNVYLYNYTAYTNSDHLEVLLRQSPPDHGTLCHLHNRLNRSNVSNPTQDFNACEDFFCTVVESHIVTASLHYLNMSKMDNIPEQDG